VDGRKWSSGNDEFDSVWPWPGASDTRVRTAEKVINERMTVALFAVMNMSLQAKSTRPTATGAGESNNFHSTAAMDDVHAHGKFAPGNSVG